MYLIASSSSLLLFLLFLLFFLLPFSDRILLVLLKELIRRSVSQSRNHPKLLLRRTQCVAEKLLANWLCFLLYPHLLVRKRERERERERERKRERRGRREGGSTPVLVLMISSSPRIMLVLLSSSSTVLSRASWRSVQWMWSLVRPGTLSQKRSCFVSH